jgi:hypothetical protein
MYRDSEMLDSSERCFDTYLCCLTPHPDSWGRQQQTHSPNFRVAPRPPCLLQTTKYRLLEMRLFIRSIEDFYSYL